MELMTKNKALKKLRKKGIGRVRLNHLLESGQLKCVPVGSSYLIPDWSLEQCLKNTINHPSSLFSGAASTTSKYRQSSTDKEYSFAKVRTQRIKEKQSNDRSVALVVS